VASTPAGHAGSVADNCLLRTVDVFQAWITQGPRHAAP
jgi:hypothetical protein